MPKNTVCVDRSTIFGNPFIMYKEEERELVVTMFENWLLGKTHTEVWVERRWCLRQRLSELKGKNLACWCRTDQACHADVLLKVANAD